MIIPKRLLCPGKNQKSLVEQVSKLNQMSSPAKHQMSSPAKQLSTQRNPLSFQQLNQIFISSFLHLQTTNNYIASRGRIKNEFHIQK